MSIFGGPIKERARKSMPLRLWYEGRPVGTDPDFVVTSDDFSNVAINVTNDWTQVKDAGAAVAYVADTAGGEVVLTSTATTDDDGASLQGNEIFLPVAGRTIWFEARVKASDADQHDFFVGLTENWGTNPEDGLAASNRIGFQINDGNASILCKSEKADTETSTDSGLDQADATYNKLGFKVNGVDSIDFYVDRVLVATITTNIPVVELAPAILNISGNNTGTHTATCDYIDVVATR